MLHAVKVKPDVYWVGGIDWNERNFHGYTTDRGSTYNAYLIMDEQVTLIDTCKPAFAGELIERISEVVDPACIEHVGTVKNLAHFSDSLISPPSGAATPPAESRPDSASSPTRSRPRT